MVDAFLSYYIIGNILVVLGQLGVWVVCLLLLLRERSWASILTFAGSSLVAVGGVAGLLIQTILARTASPEVLINYQGIVYVMNSIFYLIFAIGLILTILKYLNISRFQEAVKAE